MTSPPNESPSVAFGLSLAGGIIIILTGLVVSLVGAALTFFIAGMVEIFGFVGVFWGILIVILASLLRARPNQHVGLGVAIIVLSILSWLGSFGGFVIGFLLALIGGILAITWKPSGWSANVTVMTPPPPIPTPTPAPQSNARFCPSCGSPVEVGSNFCKHCGKSL